MLCINKIQYKNFLSSGNTFTEIDFTKTKTTLIVGKNGEGKSTTHSALIFGLYGKSNRNTTKRQLLNVINKKDLVVEVFFNIDGKDYKVIRGISPNIFEIWIDNVKQEELSAVKDQQKHLEQNILKMSFKTFNQVVVLGSNSFIPFMQLSASDRRDLVEELLDIRIFSSMNSIIKEKIKNLEKTHNEIVFKKNSVSEKINMQQTFIDSLNKDAKQVILKKNKNITNLEQENDDITEQIQITLTELEIQKEKINKISFSPKKIKSLLSIEGKLEQKKSNIISNVNFFTQNETCPTCKQDLHVDFKNKKIEDLESELLELNSGFADLKKSLHEEEVKEIKLKDIANTITELNSSILENQNKIKNNNKIIKNIKEEINEILFKIENQNEETEKLNLLLKEEGKLSKSELKCKEVSHYFQFAHLLMKDGGIKSKIIEKYLPIINTEINRYLQLMDLYLNFTLDEDFKESVKTPIHEDFSYGSFSEGEKQRISLSILFAWREVARLKNSINCNLLFLDEVFDSSLDSEGTEYLLKIINYVVKDTNIFVISHRIEELVDKFDRILEVKKINGFSKVFPNIQN
jgi:DNA repair exonuclease SbcCD ATPase subunit